MSCVSVRFDLISFRTMIIELMGKGGSLDVFGSVKGGMCQAVLVESRLVFICDVCGLL